MRNWIDFLSKKKWFQALVIFIPFTGIIDPGWYAILVFVYFIVGGYYFFMED